MVPRLNNNRHMTRSTIPSAGVWAKSTALVLFLVSSGCDDEPTDSSDSGLTSAEIGDAARGAELFEDKFCADCHAYGEIGGGDAPPLDFMRGRLTAADIANMAGSIWNHLPGMLDHFEEEGIEVPTFSGNDMADLLAYLHGGMSSGAPHNKGPAGHVGGHDVPSEELGDAAAGERLFVDKGCSDCHAFDGEGGDDAPALDGMMGHMSATEIANMSGTLWNHLPDMIEHYEEEGMSLPTFADDEMADLIAFLHGGRGRPM